MKIKHIAAVAAAMVAGTAFAQSNVTLYGVIDTGVRFENNADGKGRNATYLNNGTLSNSRFGLMGKEDLGNGLKAGFQIEAGFSANDGGQDGSTEATNKSGSKLFNRTAKVGVDSEFGSVYFGRQYTVMYDIVSLYEPTEWYNAESYVTAASIVPTGMLVPYRSDNTVYYAGTFGPVALRASYAFGGVPGSMPSGSKWAGGLSYDDSILGGNLKLGTAFSRDVSNGNPTYNTLSATGLKINGTSVPSIEGEGGIINFANSGATTYNADTVSVGGAYGYGPIKGMAGYIYKKTDGQALAAGGIGSYNQNTWFIGFGYSTPINVDLTLAYYRHKLNAKGTKNLRAFNPTGTGNNSDGKADVVVFIADYKLSKRTDLYAAYDYTRTGQGDGLQNSYMPITLSNDHTITTNAQNTRSGYTIGVRHRF